ncbi:hypothetical protein MVES1_001451 [Malassezia vespertilionis]|uniref:Ydj1p n=1 Tax=Malassezia vespertilionis TaxID=2020962 RepID=A0A2N1JF19_9BASI|nr:uncharacterized protein MVES1_001451 [Malassezia vespertilionis]PKI85157.1 hypothetical protein MVES_001367 [Malassezia vespertilionis]WFD06110.1 hypothetical protein MVES1_001451 [Malassezia vespertilionis]
MVVEARLYELLEVSVDATDIEIKKAYKRKSLANHPDKNPGDADAQRRFQDVAHAYETLSDPATRDAYDRYGEEGMRGNGGAPDMDDIFASMFGGPFAFGGAPPRKRRAQDTVLPYTVSLEDLYNGKTAAFALERNIVCTHCHGTGGRHGMPQKDCATCHGKGRVLQQRQAGGGMISQTIAECSACRGTGKKFRENDQCKKCKGEKIVPSKAKLRLEIPRGAFDGQQFVFEGDGDQLPDTKPASIIFELRQTPHSAFEVSGLDLRATVRITLLEALQGFSRTVLTHLDGRRIRVTKPKGQVVRPNEVDVVLGEGMMDLGNTRRRGDLYLAYEIEFPTDAWARDADAPTLASLLPPKRPELPDESDSVTEDVKVCKADLATYGANRGTRTEQPQSDPFDEPNVQCAQQ